jgi:hypothetical protein
MHTWPAPGTDDTSAGAPIDHDAALLEHLAARMLDARAGVRSRVARADAIVLGRVERSDVVPHQPSAVSLADAELRAVAVDDGGGPALYINLVAATVERWIVGTSGSAIGVWVEPRELVGEIGLPLVGTIGIVVLEPLPDTVVGRELARAVPGAHALTPAEPLLLPHDSAVATALGFLAPASSRDGLGRALRELHGGPLHIVLGAIVQQPSAEGEAALRARVTAGAPDADTLLVRAALARLADPAAFAGFDRDAIPVQVFDYFQLVTFHSDDAQLGLVRGPSTATPLPWVPYAG